MTASHDYLFVCGTPRSGTTALARTLNYHPDIVLGVERFKLRYSDGEYSDAQLHSLFAKDRFFAFSAEDTNVSPDMAFARKYELSKRKFDSAIYVGDKSPRLYERLRFLRRTFLACRIVFMLRDPYHVARSWQMRAMDPEDQWQRLNDYRAAVDEWNASIAHVARSIDMFRDDLIVVTYEQLFVKAPEATIAAVFSLLHLDPGQDEPVAWQRNMARYLEKSSGIASATRKLPDQVADHVRRNADFGTYEELLSLAVAP